MNQMLKISDIGWGVFFFTILNLVPSQTYSKMLAEFLNHTLLLGKSNLKGIFSPISSDHSSEILYERISVVL